MTTIKTMGTALGAVMLLVSSVGTAQAYHGRPLHALKVKYEHKRDALHNAFLAQREQIECAKRDALTDWRAARAHALTLCEPERALALRQLAGRRREIMIRFRADMAAARGNNQLQLERLNRWYDLQRRQLVMRPMFAGPEICTTRGTWPPPVYDTPVRPHVDPRPRPSRYQYEYEFRQERSAPGTEVIIPDQPLFKLDESGVYAPRRTPWEELVTRLSRLGGRQFGG